MTKSDANNQNKKQGRGRGRERESRRTRRWCWTTCARTRLLLLLLAAFDLRYAQAVVRPEAVLVLDVVVAAGAVWARLEHPRKVVVEAWVQKKR